MRMTWADLGFLHWEVAAAARRPLVPDALEIDTFEGRAFVGLVPFTMRGVRPAWAPPLPWLSRFHEVNVRTYVHRKASSISWSSATSSTPSRAGPFSPAACITAPTRCRPQM